MATPEKSLGPKRHIMAEGTDGNFYRLQCDTDGRLFVRVSPRPGSSADSSVTSILTSTELLAANAARLGATITNDSRSRLYVKLGATASITSYTRRIEPDGYWEVPFGYTGVIDGIWTTVVSGAARITELTE